MSKVSRMKTNDEFKVDLEAGELNGMYLGVSNSDYHSSPGISKSGLDMVNRSPAHFKYAPKKEPTAAMRIGTAVHTAILEPNIFKTEYMCLSNIYDRRKAEYKDAVKEFGADNVVIASEAIMISSMQEALFLNSDAFGLLELNGWSEISLFATDENGILLKCRFDRLAECGIALDLKTTNDATEYGFSKSINDYRYHVQVAFYNKVYHLLTGHNLTAFKFIAMEKEAPNYSKVWQLSQESISIGAHYMNKNLAAYTEAFKADFWPMQDDGSQSEISLPNWAINQFEAELEESIK